MKKCTKCGEEKEESLFSRHKKSRDGLRTICKMCCSSYNEGYYSIPENKAKKALCDQKYNEDPKVKEARKRYEKSRSADPKRKEKTSRYNAKYNAKPEIREKRRKYSERRDQIPEAKEKDAATAKVWGKEYRKRPEVKGRLKAYGHQYMAPYNRNRRKTDPLYNLASKLRARVGSAIKSGGYSKKSKTSELIDVSYSLLKNHLEYTWFQNYGTEYAGEPVHIDHAIPCCVAKTEEELIALQHWTNLQYLTPEDNLEKSGKAPSQEIIDNFFLTRAARQDSLNNGEGS